MEMSLEEAIKAHQEGRIEVAEEAYWRYIDSKPDEAHPYYLTAVLYQHRYEVHRAIAYIDMALERNDQNPAYHACKGQIASTLYQIESAEQSFLKALDLKQDYLEALSGISIALTKKQDFAKAEQYANLCYKHFPEHNLTHWTFGEVFLRANILDWAETAFTRSLQQDRDSVLAKIGLLEVHTAKAQTEKASEQLKELHKVDALKDAIKYAEGKHLLARNKLDDAEAVLRRCVALNPYHLEAWYMLGQCREVQNNLHAAEYAYKRAFYLNPDHLDTLCAHAQVSLQLGKKAWAQALWAQAKDINPNIPKLHELKSPRQTTTPVAPATTQTMPQATQQGGPAMGSIEERDMHLRIATELMPGPDYFTYLRYLQEWVEPATYLEIGVESGKSLALAEPPTIAAGVDPEPKIVYEFKAPTTVFPLPSDTFFEQEDLEKLFQNKAIELSFIDGLHEFHQVLRDFMNVEKHATPNTIVAFHDTYPINEITARPDRETYFWTGDPWRIVPCLKHYRKDLDIFTIKTFPSGLTIVAGLDPKSTILKDNYDEAIEQFAHYPYSEIDKDKDEALNAVDNDMNQVEARIRKHL